MKKRGQAWGFDLEIAGAIFFAGIIAFYLFAFNYNAVQNSPNEDISYEAYTVAETLLSTGIPESWNQSNVIKIGLVTNDRLDQNKINLFYNLSENDYNRTQALLRTRFNFFVNLSDSMSANGEVISGIGQAPPSTATIFRVDRFTTYESKPVTLHVLLWN